MVGDDGAGRRIPMESSIIDYQNKERFLSFHFPKFEPSDFYRFIFPLGSFERKGMTEDNKPNGLALEICGKGKAFHHLITDDLSCITELLEKDFVICSAISYYGKRRTGLNARFLYAMIFDIDGVGEDQIKDLLHQANNNLIPLPTFIVNSGGGIHLYYCFKSPLPMYPHYQQYLREFKHLLTDRLWNPYTSKRKDIEYQGVLQGFRMVGSPSKLGKEYRVNAYLVGNKVDLDYLYSFLSDENKKKIGQLKNYKKGKISIEEAQVLYPDWYQRKIIDGKRGRWNIKKDLYEWWKRKIMSEIKVGHRYYAVMALSIYAKKCNIPEDKLRIDAYNLLEAFEKLTISNDNHFTIDDIESALALYSEDYITFPRREIERLTGIVMPPNKRNGRSQKAHLQRARAVQNIDYPNGEWRNKKGGPSRKPLIKKYMKEHPNAKKSEIKRELGVSYNTIRKYYDIILEELKEDID